MLVQWEVIAPLDARSRRSARGVNIALLQLALLRHVPLVPMAIRLVSVMFRYVLRAFPDITVLQAPLCRTHAQVELISPTSENRPPVIAVIAFRAWRVLALPPQLLQVSATKVTTVRLVRLLLQKYLALLVLTPTSITPRVSSIAVHALLVWRATLVLVDFSKLPSLALLGIIALRVLQTQLHTPALRAHTQILQIWCHRLAVHNALRAIIAMPVPSLLLVFVHKGLTVLSVRKLHRSSCALLARTLQRLEMYASKTVCHALLDHTAQLDLLYLPHVTSASILPLSAAPPFLFALHARPAINVRYLLLRDQWNAASATIQMSVPVPAPHALLATIVISQLQA